MMIVLSFSSSLAISMDGIVPDMERGLVALDIVLRGEEVVVKRKEMEDR
jgi:hypothetical protein